MQEFKACKHIFHKKSMVRSTFVAKKTRIEKFKKIKAGGVNRYVYYRCTKSKYRKCKNPAITEPDLIKALLELIDSLSLDEVKLTAKLNLEIQKFKKLQAMFLGKKRSNKIEAVDLQDYAKFVLNEGAVLEQRSILGCIANELVLEDKNVCLDVKKVVSYLIG